jgi:hypothetical protein
VAEIQDDREKEALKKQAQGVHLRALLGAVVLTALAVLVP